jgi:hypothetical protein
MRVEEPKRVSGVGGVDGTPTAGTSGTNLLLSFTKVDGGLMVDDAEVDT